MKFKMKDLGAANYILGIKITRDRKRKLLSISQKLYIENILARFNMLNADPVGSPMDPHVKLSKGVDSISNMENEELRLIPYQSAIGAVMYLMLGTRPDLAFTVTFLSQFNNNYRQEHWTAVKRLLRYIKGTSEWELTYGLNDSGLIGYCDADYADDVATRRSFTGYVFMLNGGAVSWQAKKQTTVTLSTAEAEYLAQTEAVKEGLWWKQFIGELDLDCVDSNTIQLYGDNQAAIALTKNPEFHQRTKHIDIRHHFIREHVNNGDIKLDYINTDGMIADVLTKPLAKNAHMKLSRSMGLQSNSTLSGSVGSQ